MNDCQPTTAMTLDQARKLFGLGPDDDPRPYLADYRLAREHIAELVRSAPDEALALNYQAGLVEFDQALAAILESLAPPEPLPAAEISAPPEAALPATVVLPTPRHRSYGWGIFLLAMLLAAACLLYYKNEETKTLQRQARITLLEREGSILVENRRWQEASKAFAEIEKLAPGSHLALLGRRSIEVGMAEEQTQFVGYWTGQAIAELEAVRLDEAQAAIQRVLDLYPTEPEALAIRLRITAARASQTRAAELNTARQLLNDRHWNAAITAARRILTTTPDDAEALAIITDASTALEKYTADHAKAKELLDKAVARDHGEFDTQVLEWLRDAAALAPDNTDIAARLEKMASYTRTIRVPEDFATPAAALAVARDHDRIVLAEKTWPGPLVVNAAVELQGAGSAKTIVECPAAVGSAITLGPAAKGARISGITFRHESFLAMGNERFSAALIRGANATFVECRFSDASGHGLVVIEQGAAIANRCRFSDNGWNGAAAIGKGSALEIRDSEALDNFEHGIESWDGATVTLVNNRCEGNCRTGIHADNGTAAAIIEGNQLIANREFGLVLESAGSGKISTNTVRANLLGGLVIRTAAANLPVSGNRATLNLGPGMVLEKGLNPAAYTNNSVKDNTSQQVLTDANLSQKEVPKAELPKESAAGKKPAPPASRR